MNCSHCEDQMSAYLENELGSSERTFFEGHLRTCEACSELLSGMKEVIGLTKAFPIYSAPAWLPVRIVAQTPRIQRETWGDTLSYIGRWLLTPRTALALFTSAIVLGWIGSLTGISSNVGAMVRNPSAIYFQAGDLVDRAYDQAVRGFYSAQVVTEIQSEIERIREIS